jgi:hypothetical protein
MLAYGVGKICAVDGYGLLSVCVVYGTRLTLSLLMSHICCVSKMFGEWYQKTNKTEDTNKLTLF